jgi:hypothetical protein
MKAILKILGIIGCVFYLIINPLNAQKYQAGVQIKDKRGFIDKTGKMSISPQFEDALIFVIAE